MTDRKETVSFTEPAFAYAQSLVEASEYPSISGAVSGEMVRAKAAQAALLAAEVKRRLALPVDRWEPVGALAGVAGPAWARLAELRRKAAGKEKDRREGRQPEP